MKLVVAEKPSVAMSLSKVIGATKRQDGYLEGNGYLVSWCVGHLVELSAPERYDERFAKWRLEDLPILPERFLYEVSAGTRKQYQLLKGLMERPDVESLVCATDAGREGFVIHSDGRDIGDLMPEPELRKLEPVLSQAVEYSYWKKDLDKSDTPTAVRDVRNGLFETENLNLTRDQITALHKEIDRLRQRMDEASVKNCSAFIRKMSLDGYIVKLDMDDIHEMIRLLRNATNNLNQIAKKANSGDGIYGADIAAKQAFDELGVRKIPKVKDLSAEYADILSGKKAAYADYRKARDEAQELAIAERNIASLYDAERKEEQERQTAEKAH